VTSLELTETSAAGERSEVVSALNSESAANGLIVKYSEERTNGTCSAKLSIVGKGISKNVDYPCGKTSPDIINLGAGLVVGDEWFTDSNNTLVHLTGNKCQKEVFTTQDGKTSSTLETLSDDECKKVRDKIVELKKEQDKWKEWLAKQQEALQNQFQKLQQNFAFLQEKLGGLFG